MNFSAKFMLFEQNKLWQEMIPSYITDKYEINEINSVS